MVDEYQYTQEVDYNLYLFRFLYGRWIPDTIDVTTLDSDGFRFLYGRWIRAAGNHSALHKQVQIPLWSMNTE